MKVSMHKKERRSFYEENLEIFKKASVVFAVSDYYAIDLLQYLSENHFEIPKDISIAGFDEGVPLGLLSAFWLNISIPYVYFILSLEECVRFLISMVVFKKKTWMQSL